MLKLLTNRTQLLSSITIIITIIIFVGGGELTWWSAVFICSAVRHVHYVPLTRLEETCKLRCVVTELWISLCANNYNKLKYTYILFMLPSRIIFTAALGRINCVWLCQYESSPGQSRSTYKYITVTDILAILWLTVNSFPLLLKENYHNELFLRLKIKFVYFYV